MTEEDPVGGSSRSTKAFKRAQQEARIHSSGIGIPAHPANAMPRSGIMPSAKGQVLCPYCRKGFDFSSALLNRQIRCNGCRGVFRVGDDRRSFKLQAPPPPPAELPSAEAGTASHMARVAISTANSNLNEIAKLALRSIERQEQAAPRRREGSSDAPFQTTSPGTARLARSKAPTGPVLTGDGLAEGRRSRKMWTIVGGSVAAVLVIFLLYRLMHDGSRMAALEDFQAPRPKEQTWGERIAGMRSRTLKGSVAPIVALDHARFGSVVTLDLSGLHAALDGMRLLKRGEIWVDANRLDEAKGLLTQAASGGDILARCKKVGITTRTWAEVLASAKSGQPSGYEDVLSMMFSNADPADGGFDPVDVFDRGQWPTALQVSSFEGHDGALLQQAGRSLTRPYRGRLVRGHGPGWPDRWMILDLTLAH